MDLRGSVWRGNIYVYMVRGSRMTIYSFILLLLKKSRIVAEVQS